MPRGCFLVTRISLIVTLNRLRLSSKSARCILLEMSDPMIPNAIVDINAKSIVNISILWKSGSTAPCIQPSIVLIKTNKNILAPIVPMILRKRLFKSFVILFVLNGFVRMFQWIVEWCQFFQLCDQQYPMGQVALNLKSSYLNRVFHLGNSVLCRMNY